MDDIVGRAFAQRFLAGNGQPALYLRRMLQHRVPRGVLRHSILIYTARANRILHDFVREVYWTKHQSGAGEVGKEEAREFIERAISRGDVEPRWSDTMIERVTRYLLGTLVDFELITANAFGQRQIRPRFIAPETVVYLAYEIHQSGADDYEVVRHRDWGLLGLSQADVISLLENAATQGHIFIQHSGALVRMEWKYARMEDMIDALAH